MNSNLMEKIADADMVLIGIGYEFSTNFCEFASDSYYQELKEKVLQKQEAEWILPFLEVGRLEKQKAHPLLEAYNKLARIMEGKNYFIVSLNQDSIIEKSELNTERIVAPCGTTKLLQCNENCKNLLWESSIYVKKICEEVGRKTDVLEELERPICPNCGKELVFNNVHAAQYNEEGYLERWKVYTKWLQGTLNHKLCVLELGVGMEYPNIIRWPFEKIVFYNQKAKFIRVHHKLFHMSEELKEKGEAISENAVKYLLEQNC